MPREWYIYIWLDWFVIILLNLTKRLSEFEYEIADRGAICPSGIVIDAIFFDFSYKSYWYSV